MQRSAMSWKWGIKRKTKEKENVQDGRKNWKLGKVKKKTKENVEIFRKNCK